MNVGYGSDLHTRDVGTSQYVLESEFVFIIVRCGLLICMDHEFGSHRVV